MSVLTKGIELATGNVTHNQKRDDIGYPCPPGRFIVGSTGKPTGQPVVSEAVTSPYQMLIHALLKRFILGI
jgi:hypothetical protein